MASKKNLDIYMEEFILKYKSGISIRKIAEEYNVNKNSVGNILKKNGIIFEVKNKLNDKKVDVYNDYLKGLNANEISKKYEVSHSTVSRFLSKHFGIITTDGNRKYEHLTKEFIELYQKGLSLKEIGEKFNVSKNIVHKYLIDESVELRNYSETSRIYEMKEDYFEVLNEEKAFLLGRFFSYAKLYEAFNTHIVVLAIAKHKKSILLELVAEIADKGEECLVEDDKDISYSITLNSKIFYDSLKKYGVKNNKVEIEEKYLKSFFKGYFKDSLKVNREGLAISCKRLNADCIKDFLIKEIGEKSCYSLKNGSFVLIKNKTYINKLINIYPEVIDKLNIYLSENNSPYWQKYLELYKKKES